MHYHEGWIWKMHTEFYVRSLKGGDPWGDVGNSKVRYRVHKGPPLVHILSQMNPVFTLVPYFSKILCNIVSLSTPRSSTWSLSFRFSNQNICISHLSHPYYMPRPFHPHRFEANSRSPSRDDIHRLLRNPLNRVSSVGIATGWTIGLSGFDSRGGLGVFFSPPCPDRLWDPPSLLSNGYGGLFPWR
jgi:hypothetical protein